MIVHTTSGPVAGTTGPLGHRFLGIPYAAPPTGTNRFRPPAVPATWTSPRQCEEFGPAAPQGVDVIREQLFGQPPLSGDEAGCLTLNVFCPQPDDHNRPVLFWIHGGGFTTGAGVDPMFDGSRLAAGHDIVVVTINYRLGALGFLYLEELLGPAYAGSGAVGILDQAAALRWVRDNICRFGGDPDNVTIVGQSAGAMSVATLMSMPEMTGLFHRAIIQSGSGEFVRTRAQGTRVTRELLAILDIPAESADRLLELPVSELIAAQQQLAPRLADDPSLFGVPFSPVVDGAVVPMAPLQAIRAGSGRGKPLLIGTTSDEAGLFAWEGNPAAGDQAAIAALTARLFEEPTDRLVQAQLQHTWKVWRYSFRWRTPVADGVLGACHSLDLPFVFDCLDLPGLDSFVGSAPPRRLAEEMGKHWAAFARAGDPGGNWLPVTNPGTDKNKETIILDANSGSPAPSGPAEEIATDDSGVMNSAGMRVAGVVNLRDVGGQRTTDGRIVAHGQVYRSGALRPTDDDRKRLAELGLTAVYDLRTPNEAVTEPDEVPEGAAYFLFNVYGNDHLVDVPADPAQGREIMLNIYRRYITGEPERAAFGELFRSLARTDGPQLFHCASGKDRTGWAAAALLLLLGVPMHEIAVDFVLSNEFIADSPGFQRAMSELTPEQAAAFRPFAVVSPDYLTVAVAELEAVYGDVNGYFQEGLGVSETDIDALRSRLLASGVHTNQR